jgi:hypothetical protein
VGEGGRLKLVDQSRSPDGAKRNPGFAIPAAKTRITLRSIRATIANSVMMLSETVLGAAPGSEPSAGMGRTQPQLSGQAAPASTQARISWPNTFWLPGAGSRPAPGDQPQPTRLSSAM